MILLVNKKHLFNEDMIKDFKMVEYENSDEELIYIESETFRHYEMLRAHLKIEGIKIDISSGYRSLEKQENLFLEFMNKYGIDYAESVVAMPGTSEHHTGLAIDICLYNGDKLIYTYGYKIENLASKTSIYIEANPEFEYKKVTKYEFSIDEEKIGVEPTNK